VAAAGRARALSGVAPAPSMASQACVRAASGTWLTVRASLLGTDGQVGVVREPARSQQLAPLIAQAYELTDREREVSELVAEGLATDEIAGRLCISPWTVQDHLKSIFEKVACGRAGSSSPGSSSEQRRRGSTAGPPRPSRSSGANPTILGWERPRPGGTLGACQS